MPGGGPRVPIGVYDHEPTDDIPGVHSVGVGDSFPSRLAKSATDVRNKLASVLDDLSPLP